MNTSMTAASVPAASPPAETSATTEISSPAVEKAKRLAVVGQGYVGLPLTMRAVAAGYDVVGFDLDEQRIKRLSVGESYVEDVSDADLAAALETGRFRPSSQVRDCAGF